MAPKPDRTLGTIGTIADRVAGYADDASAYLRRRRLARRPYARVGSAGGQSISCEPDTECGRELFLAASRVLDAAR